MDFRIAPETLELVEAVRGFLAGTHGPEVLRRLDAGGNRDADIWNGIVEMGLPGLLVPEDLGGLGLTLLDATLVARECGRVALAEPLVESAYVMVPWMMAKGYSSDMAAIAAGEARPLPVHAINGWETDGDGEPLESIDPLRNLTTAQGTQEDDGLLLDLGALMSAAQMIGLAEAMLDQSVEYSKIREQFGQPIGGFQAIKHKLAEVALALEFARPVVWRAAQALEEGLESVSIHVSHAKLAASAAGYLAAESAIQVHGAMGYTYEVDLHFWAKRTWALAGAWGDKSFHAKRVSDAVLGGEHPIGSSYTFA